MLGNHSEVIIIGGGIIGFAIANRLAQAGLSVQVLERSHPCREASWAAAGMLAPHAELAHGTPKPLYRLLLAGRKIYPAFVRELEAATNLHIGVQAAGSLLLARDYGESKLLAGLMEKASEGGYPVEDLTAAEVHGRQAGLHEHVEAGLYFPEDMHIENRMLCQALLKASSSNGVVIRDEAPVTGFEVTGGRISAVRTPRGRLHADKFILTAGSWSGELLANLGLHVPVRPIRGQIVELHVKPQYLRSLIHTGSCYIVPWPDGRTLIGATMENVGFDKSVTADGVAHLLSAALAYLPSLKTAELRRMWAGLRPDTSDNMPVIGQSEIDNLVIATGHFRNGILLAPITADLVYQIMTERETAINLTPFRPGRFSEAQ